MADEPVSAWREPLARRARRWARRNRTLVTGAAAALLAGTVGLAGGAGRADEGQGRPGQRQRRIDPQPGRGAGPLRPGRRGDQDLPHRRQRGLPAQAGPVQGPARPAPEVGQRLLRQARGPAQEPVRLRLAAGTAASQLRGRQPDRNGRTQGRRPRDPSRGAGGAGVDGPGAAGRSRVDGRRRPQPDGRRCDTATGRQVGRSAGDLSQGDHRPG